MSSLQGLPPVPKSLTPFLLTQQHSKETTKSIANNKRPLPRTPPKEPPPPPPPIASASLTRKPSSTSNLDLKLQTLRREMAGLRQLDMLLMQDLLTLQQSVQDVKMLMSDSSRSLGSPSSPVDAWELGISFNTGLPLTSVKEDGLSSSTSSISSAEKA